MKIQGPSSTRGTSSTKKTGKSKGAGGADFAKALEGEGASETQESQNVATSGGVSAVDALLSIQQVDDATSGGGNAQAFAWGEDMLEQLELLRLALLSGSIPPEQLQRLAESVSKKRATALDPKLASILSDIETRAQVELAKHQRDSA